MIGNYTAQFAIDYRPKLGLTIVIPNNHDVRNLPSVCAIAGSGGTGICVWFVSLSPETYWSEQPEGQSCSPLFSEKLWILKKKLFR